MTEFDLVTFMASMRPVFFLFLVNLRDVQNDNNYDVSEVTHCA